MIIEKNTFKTAPQLAATNSRATLDLLKLKLLALSLAQQQTPSKGSRLFKSFMRNPLD